MSVGHGWWKKLLKGLHYCILGRSFARIICFSIITVSCPCIVTYGLPSRLM